MNNKYGWENDLDMIWLNIINSALKKKGVISPDEFEAIRRLILHNYCEERVKRRQEAVTNEDNS